MRKEDLRIVYMGTPEFAVEPLRCLVEGGYNIAGVITMPDKPAGRGHKVQFSPVKQYALEHGLPLLQPEKLKDETFVEALRALNADLQIVVAFRMLPGDASVNPYTLVTRMNIFSSTCFISSTGQREPAMMPVRREVRSNMLNIG